MPTHAMSCFKIPQSLCKRIQSALTRFWWDAKPGIRNISWVSWKNLSFPPSVGGLGFREIEEFNVSLLAKLSWRIYKNPESLVAQVLTGKYCGGSPFLDCKATSDSSHGWSGILAGRELLHRGIGWLIGDGTDIKVWQNAWLSTKSPMTPIGPPPLSSMDITVAALTDPDTRTWNIAAIRHFLPHYEVIILQLPLSSFPMKDSRVWLQHPSGNYDTKSGYAMAKVHTLPQTLEEFDWKACIWKVNTLPKLRHFLWKIKSRALPVGHNLEVRGITHCSRCKFCDANEDELYIFLLCPFACQVWNLIPVLFKLEVSPSPTIAQLLSTSRRQVNLPPTGLSSTPLYPWVFWHLWKARNSRIFEDRWFTQEEVSLKAITEARSWHLAQDESPPKVPRRKPVWTPSPPSPSTRCYVDAAWLAASLDCGIGWCFKDNDATLISQHTSSRRLVSSVLLAEALAIKTAVKAALDAGIRDLSVFSDSLSLVNLLNSTRVTNELKPVLHDIHCLSSDFSSIMFFFIPREANVCAYALAKRGLVLLNAPLLAA